MLVNRYKKKTKKQQQSIIDTYKLFTGIANYGLMQDFAGQSTGLIALPDDAPTINEESNI